MKFGVGFALGLIVGLLIGGFFYLSKPAVPVALPTPDGLEREVRYQVNGLTETGAEVKLNIDINGSSSTANRLPFEVVEKARAGDSVSMTVLNQSPAETRFGFLGCKILSNGVEIAFEMAPTTNEFVMCSGVVR